MNQQLQQQQEMIDANLASEDQLMDKLVGIEDVLADLHYQLLGGVPMGATNQQPANSELPPQILDQVKSVLGQGATTSPSSAVTQDMLNTFRAQLLNDVDSRFDQKSAAMVEDIIKAQKEGRPFYLTPIFLGGVAAAVILTIGGVLYLYRQDIKELKELTCDPQAAN